MDLDATTRLRPTIIPGQCPCDELRGSRVMLLVIQTKHAMFVIAATRMVWN